MQFWLSKVTVMRFVVAVAVAAVMVVVVVVEGATAEAHGRIELSIPQGRLSGLRETTLKGRTIYTFRKIPFAKPPVADLRFKDPEPAVEWDGVLDASSDPPRCIQQSLNSLISPDKNIEGSEDCLYINVYTPKVDLHAKLPVLVHIYGGGFFAGRADEYVPNVLLDRDVLLVVPQYRVGTLGFLSTEDSVIPGNFGLKDQTLALRWIQQNIGFFGGDPNKVALFGISAGGVSAHYQMFVPEAKGLFSRALLQSGTILALGRTFTDFQKVAYELGGALQCPVHQGSHELLECLQNVPAHTIVETTANMFSYPMVMVPRVDGSYLPDEPDVLLSSGRFTKVPTISGVMEHEGAFITNEIYSSDTMRQRISSDIVMAGLIAGIVGDPNHVESQVRETFDHFIGGYNISEDNADMVTQIFSDMAFVVGQDVTALVHSRHHPVYTYEIKHRSKHSLGDVFGTEMSKRWITHADDLIYLFEGGRFKTLEREDDLALRDLITALWANFAETGNPTPDDSLGFKWESVKEQSFRQLVLGPKPHMEDVIRKERRDFFLNLPHFQDLKKILEAPPRDEL
ncbi:juvenile hormone esterase-like [Oratosquilla oratoria]|uniref:juvenile hormone esterase-like n=1 Tax=Oratosquilla oratoria TaxID=337810 RepID=UPI003F757AF2